LFLRYYPVFRPGIEAGTGLAFVEVAVAADGGLREPLLQLDEQRPERSPLTVGTCVGCQPLAVAAAHVAYVDALGVAVALVAGSGLHKQRPSVLQRAVKAYQIVVAYHREASFPVPLVYLLGSHLTPLGRVGAMNHNILNLSHNFIFSILQFFNFLFTLIAVLLGKAML